MNRILKAFLRRLTNLSTRNKSLLLASLPAEQFLDIHELDFLLGKSSFHFVQQLIEKKSRIALCDVQDPRYEKVNEISKKLRKIARTARFIEEERGSRDLYVGYPFVRGKLADGTPIHAPLLFFPVTLQADREQWCLLNRDEPTVILNRSFALAYAHFNEVLVADDVLEKSFEDFPADALEFRTSLYEWLKETPFRINFNQELFVDKLSTFDIQKGSDLDRMEKNGELKLFPEAVLGIFPQAGSYLVPDYNQLLSRYDEEPFQMPLLIPEDAGLTRTRLPAKNTPLKEEEVLTPFSIDESQEEIIHAVQRGKSVVVQGPPGSGKSQLICNLMAGFAAQGKRVLLVCQKRAALDVVYRRLETIGMNLFVALIHDFKNDRTALYSQFASQIEQVEAYRKQNYGLDAVFLERQFKQESRQIDQTLQALNDFRSALFDDSECGISVKELYLTCSQESPSIALEHYRFFRPDGCDDYKRKLKIFGKYSMLIDASHPWRNRRNFAAFGLNDLRVIEKMLLDWPDAFRKQAERFEQMTGLPFSISFYSSHAEAVERLDDILVQISDDSTFLLLKDYLASESPAYERLAFIRQTADTLDGFITEHGIEFSLKATQLTDFRIRLKDALDAKRSMVSGVWWSLFGADKKVIEEVASRNQLTTAAEDLAKLEVRVRNRAELELWLTNPVLGFRDKYLDPAKETGQQFTEFFQSAEKAADALVGMNFPHWREVISAFVTVSEDIANFRSRITGVIAWMKSWDRMQTAMSPFLTMEQIENLILEPERDSTRLLNAIRKDFDSIVDMDQLWGNMSDTEQNVTERILEKCRNTGELDGDHMVSLFDNSLRLAWLNHIESKFPDLRAVTSLKISQWEEELQESVVSKQKLSAEIVNINLREKTYEDVERNRLGNRVTYRELSHQVSKKRKIWPIRKLLEHHKEEIFSLVPCWMTSPEAASAIFPMEAGLFDLVIFDEASQCYAEYGLPTAFRGKQVVVSGDSKQLPPNDLYRVRYDEKSQEEEIPVALEVESLLDLSAQTLDQYQLSGHYRSLSLDLIDFSNQHFYKNSLRLLPDFRHINSAAPGIEYMQVNGIWEDHVNMVEVQKVLEILRSLEGKDRSVGVVSFNFYQQQVIQENVEKEGILVKELFVKNIENVQGDERDIIIFTVGYAPDSKGKLSMQFGSLNMQGGENRLNVAITRAREKIYLVTSLHPSQLATDQAAHEGPKLLKAYMQYALEVSGGHYRPKPIETSSFRSDWLLKDRIMRVNPTYHKELPFGDLTEKQDGEYRGLLLTDDDIYHRSQSSKEPHAYLPLRLKLMNWPFRRVYSRQYWNGSLKVLE